jgi:hypothetical protein
MTKLERIDELFDFAFSSDNPGYRQGSVEIPHGNGRADAVKRYAHVGPRYGVIKSELAQSWFNRFFEVLDGIAQAHRLPRLDPTESALRCLEYPAHTGGEPHTDFCLMTLNVWRSHSGAVVTLFPDGTEEAATRYHFGELSPLLGGPAADLHYIEARPEVQRSIVFFGLPARDTRLSTGETCGEWLDRVKPNRRSR